MSKSGAVPDDLEDYARFAVAIDGSLEQIVGRIRAATQTLQDKSLLGFSTSFFLRYASSYIENCRGTDTEAFRVAAAFRAADRSHRGYAHLDTSKVEKALKSVRSDVTVPAPSTVERWAAKNPDGTYLASRFDVHFNSIDEWRLMTSAGCSDTIIGPKNQRGSGYLTGPNGLTYPLVNPDPRAAGTWRTVAASDIEVVRIGDPSKGETLVAGLLAFAGTTNPMPPMNNKFYATNFGITPDGIPYSTGHESPVEFTSSVPQVATSKGDAAVSALEGLATAVATMRTWKNGNDFAARAVYQEDAAGHRRAILEVYQAYDRGSYVTFMALVAGFTAGGHTLLTGRRLDKKQRESGSSKSTVFFTPGWEK